MLISRETSLLSNIILNTSDLVMEFCGYGGKEYKNRFSRYPVDAYEYTTNNMIMVVNLIFVLFLEHVYY